MKTLLLLFAVLGGMSPYTERGATDFDTVLEALDPYGVWQPHAELAYIFKPHQATTPFREGQWFYTDFGWAWQGNSPISWATDHYGSWKRLDNIWVWAPNDRWSPAAVQWRISERHIGWRPCAVDPLTAPVGGDQNLNPQEWNFIPMERMGAPLKPENFAGPEMTKKLLETSMPCQHVFKGWREMERPGPDPTTLSPDKPPTIYVIRSLPALDTKPKENAPEDIFFYHPKFYQDADGIFRRIEVCIKRAQTIQHPPSDAEVTQQKQELLDMLGGSAETPSEKKP